MNAVFFCSQQTIQKGMNIIYIANNPGVGISCVRDDPGVNGGLPYYLFIAIFHRGSVGG